MPDFWMQASSFSGDRETKTRRSIMKAESNQSEGTGQAAKMAYRTVKVDGLDIFYR